RPASPPEERHRLGEEQEKSQCRGERQTQHIIADDWRQSEQKQEGNEKTVEQPRLPDHPRPETRTLHAQCTSLQRRSVAETRASATAYAPSATTPAVPPTSGAAALGSTMIWPNDWTSAVALAPDRPLAIHR